MSDLAISAVQFDDYALVRLNINCVNYDLAENAEIGNVELSVNVNNPEIYNDNGRKIAPVFLSVLCSLQDSLDEEGQTKELVKMEYSGRVGVSAFFDDEMSDDECKHLLIANGVSYLYAKARTYFELVTAQGPLHSFSLPGIDPSRMFLDENAE